MTGMKNGKIAPGPGKKYSPQLNGVDKIHNGTSLYADSFLKKHSEICLGKYLNQSKLRSFYNEWIFPGKCFPCYRNKIGENGEVLPPPTCSELMRSEEKCFKMHLIIVLNTILHLFNTIFYSGLRQRMPKMMKMLQASVLVEYVVILPLILGRILIITGI